MKRIKVSLSAGMLALFAACQGSIAVIPVSKNAMYYVRSNAFGSDSIEYCEVDGSSAIRCKEVSVKLEYRFLNPGQ